MTLSLLPIKGCLYVQDLVRRLKQDQRGVTMLEYSVLIGIITAAVIVSVGTAGTWVSTQWTTITTNLP